MGSPTKSKKGEKSGAAAAGVAPPKVGKSEKEGRLRQRLPHRKWENQKKRGVCGRGRPTESGKIRKSGAAAAGAVPQIMKNKRKGSTII